MGFPLAEEVKEGEDAINLSTCDNKTEGAEEGREKEEATGN